DGRAAVDRALALVLRLRPAHHEPLVARALERELRSLELELGIAGRRVGALQVLRDEPEARLTGESGVRGVGAGGTRDPAAPRHEGGPSGRGGGGGSRRPWFFGAVVGPHAAGNRIHPCREWHVGGYGLWGFLPLWGPRVGRGAPVPPAGGPGGVRCA